MVNDRVEESEQDRDQLEMSQLTAGPIDEHEPEDVQVEVEQLTDESQEVNDTGSLVAQSVHHVNADYHAINGPTTGSPSPSQRAPGKRTIILPPQRQILEDFYRTGMTSAGQHLHHLHQAAVDRTGLDISVVKVRLHTAMARDFVMLGNTCPI